MPAVRFPRSTDQRHGQRTIAASGVGDLAGWASSPLLFAAGSQLAVVDLLSSGAAAPVVVATALVINLRGCAAGRRDVAERLNVGVDHRDVPAADAQAGAHRRANDRRSAASSDRDGRLRDDRRHRIDHQRRYRRVPGAAGLLGHAAWDVYDHRANKVAVRSLAEFCFVLDTLLAVAIVIVAVRD
jgi:hypothetical protein